MYKLVFAPQAIEDLSILKKFVPGSQIISTSIEIRFALFICSISAVPPLKTNGHPDTARASNNENARMAFSIRVGFV